MKYRKKPVVIEAMQLQADNAEKIFKWINVNNSIVRLKRENGITTLEIETLEGMHRALLYDWIIKGVKGEFYPCKPDIFEMTYEALNSEGGEG